MARDKDKQIRELEDEVWVLRDVRKLWRAIGIIVIVVLLFLMVIYIKDYNGWLDTQEELAKCQDKLPETQWKCPVLLEKGMYSLRGGGVLISPLGKELKCEVIEW